MFPYLIEGDIIFPKKTHFSRLHVNDFITFRRDHQLVTHRIIYIPPLATSWLFTKGDTNLKRDKKVYKKHIIGKVTEVKRNNSLLDPTQVYFFQSSLYFQELKKITTLFTSKKIQFIFLKGLPLHLYYEKSFPKRLYADCDILIATAQIPKAIELLEMRGYTEDTLARAANEVSYYKSLGGFRIILDIHTDAVFLSLHSLGENTLLYPKTLLRTFTQTCLNQKRLITIDNVPFPILTLPYLLVYLLLHLFHHNYKGYYRYELINSILQSQKKIPYSEVIQIIKSQKIEGYIYPVFIFLQTYYGHTFPKGFLAKIHPSREKMTFITRMIRSYDIFSEDYKSIEGTKKFLNVLILSPRPIFIKLGIFTQLQLWKLLVRTIILYLRRSLLNNIMFFK